MSSLLKISSVSQKCVLCENGCEARTKVTKKKHQHLIATNRIGSIFITNDDSEKPPCEIIRDVVSNMITNELSNAQCSIEMFNGQKNNSSNTTNASALHNFEVTKKFLCSKRTTYLHVFIQGMNKSSFRPLLSTMKNNDNSNSIEAKNQSALSLNTSKSNQLVNALDIDDEDDSEEKES